MRVSFTESDRLVASNEIMPVYFEELCEALCRQNYEICVFKQVLHIVTIEH